MGVANVEQTATAPLIADVVGYPGKRCKRQAGA